MHDDNFIRIIRNDILRNNLFQKGSGIVIGVSGGADSVCLLKVLKDLQAEFDLKLTAVHLNHNLRGKEADEDQAFVQELCSKWNIDLKIFNKDVNELAKEKKISVEEAGRIARYSLFNKVLKDCKAQYIAVAHQKEDQAETIMLNILRGTGLDGLCGMGIKQGNIIRPLLNVSRKQIEEYLEKNNVPFCIDSTNLDSDYTRNRVRNELFPIIQNMFGADPVSQLVKISAVVQNERDFLEAEAMAAYNKVISKDFSKDSELINISLEKFNSFPLAIKKRIIRIAWEKINKDRKNLEYIHVEQVLNLCENRTTGKKVELPRGIEVKVSYGCLIFSPKYSQELSSFSYPIQLNGITEAVDAGGILKSEVMSAADAFKIYGSPERIKENDYNQLFDYDKLNGKLILRSRAQGDVIKLSGLGGEKKLKKFFIDQKIQREKRDKIPLVAKDNQIVWIVGMRISEEFKAKKETKNVLVLSWNFI
ncbi:MAG: tRNA lysidine(34) synthetase TilS [Clostridiaceae bacterium]|nr:tRNA lysidine(34) synthetase TilS [Clostridiaceae bacterium]